MPIISSCRSLLNKHWGTKKTSTTHLTNWKCLCPQLSLTTKSNTSIIINGRRLVLKAVPFLILLITIVKSSRLPKSWILMRPSQHRCYPRLKFISLTSLLAIEGALCRCWSITQVIWFNIEASEDAKLLKISQCLNLPPYLTLTWE